MNKEYTVTDSDAGSRLDVFLSAQPDNPSRSNIQKMITEGNVSVNGQVKRANYKLRPADNIVMTYQPPQEIEAVPEDIPLDILYEDSDIIVVNKARGMVVHPAAGVYTGTLVNALLYHCGDELSGINGKIRPGIVHRLDKDTSGVMVVAKNDFAHNSLAEQIGSKTAVKEYRQTSRRPQKNGSRNLRRQTGDDRFSRTGTVQKLHFCQMPPAHGAHAPNPRAYGIYRPPADWRPEILQQQK